MHRPFITRLNREARRHVSSEILNDNKYLPRQPGCFHSPTALLALLIAATAKPLARLSSPFWPLTPTKTEALDALIRKEREAVLSTRAILGGIFGSDNDAHCYAPPGVSFHHSARHA